MSDVPPVFGIVLLPVPVPLRVVVVGLAVVGGAVVGEVPGGAVVDGVVVDGVVVDGRVVVVEPVDGAVVEVD